MHLRVSIGACGPYSPLALGELDESNIEPVAISWMRMLSLTVAHHALRDLWPRIDCNPLCVDRTECRGHPPASCSHRRPLASTSSLHSGRLQSGTNGWNPGHNVVVARSLLLRQAPASALISQVMKKSPPKPRRTLYLWRCRPRLTLRCSEQGRVSGGVPDQQSRHLAGLYVARELIGVWPEIHDAAK